VHPKKKSKAHDDDVHDMVNRPLTVSAYLMSMVLSDVVDVGGNWSGTVIVSLCQCSVLRGSTSSLSIDATQLIDLRVLRPDLRVTCCMHSTVSAPHYHIVIVIVVIVIIVIIIIRIVRL